MKISSPVRNATSRDSYSNDSPSLQENPSCFLYGPGDARFHDHPVPIITDSRDVIIRIQYVGVCGSDVHFWSKGGVRLIVSPENPLVMGHEAAGTVHAIGPGVASLHPGDKVALEPGVPCRFCVRCREGRYNLCADMKFAAAPPDSHGCLTKYYKIPEDYCHKLPANVGLEEGPLVEPLAVAVHACRLAGIKPGSTVVVFGAGTVGLMSAAVAKAFGAKKVVSIDIAQSKLEFAKSKKLADVTWIPDTELTAEHNADQLINEAELASGADVVVETSGVGLSVNTAIHALRVGGSFVQVGLGRPKIEFPILRMSEKELELHGCFRYGPGDFELAIDLLASSKIDIGGFITRILPFEQATEAWETTKRGEGIKTVIEGPRD